MKKLALGAAAALALSVPAIAPAQSNILVVDTDRVLSECTACVAANSQLQTMVQQAQQLQQQLQAPLQTQGQALQNEVRALNGREPDAALQQRIQAYSTQEQSANQQLAQREQQIRSTQAHVSQQLGTRLIPIVEQIRTTRRASLVLPRSSALAADNSLDITTEVLAELNRQVPSVSVTPLPQPAQAPAAAQQQRPQGR
jgi:outer membrane protein